MAGEKWYTIENISHKNCAKKKKEIKNQKTNNKRKVEKSDKEKNEAKGKLSKKSIKGIYQGNFNTIFQI